MTDKYKASIVMLVRAPVAAVWKAWTTPKNTIYYEFAKRELLMSAVPRCKRTGAVVT